MNLRPATCPGYSCAIPEAGFFEVFPTIGFSTTASLKWSTTAAMAKTPPNRSYRLFSGSGAACSGGASVTVKGQQSNQEFFMRSSACII